MITDGSASSATIPALGGHSTSVGKAFYVHTVAGVVARKVDSMRDHKRILVAGDSHGDNYYLRCLYAAAIANDCDAVYVVGDFGFGSRDDNSEFLDHCSTLANVHDIPLYWLDGNHEDHSTLRDGYLLPHFTEAALASRPPSPFCEIRPNLYHTWRGAQWVWSDRRFVSVGGAYSVDKAQRVKYVSWWPTEEMSEGDFTRIYDSLQGVKADVLLTHDVPSDSDMGLGADWKSDFPLAHPNRVRLQMIADLVQPKLLLHGHMHYAYTHKMDVRGQPCVVRGLGANFGSIAKSSVILDLTSNPEGMVLFPVERDS